MKIGLLPLYVMLYDERVPAWRPRLEEFYREITARIEARGIAVEASPFCRVEAEFADAVARFEQAGVDAIVTIHMAYSPSLEAIEPLASTKLPIVVLDTTETLNFSNTQSSDEIGYNHGIHGVMDLCSMLIRRGKDFEIVAGHYDTSDCLDRLCGRLRAHVAAHALRRAKVALIGGHFAGMGDFRVEYDELRDRFGIAVAVKSAAEMKAYYDAVTEAEVASETAAMREKYKFEDDTLIPEEFAETVRSCLATRACLAAESLTAFTATFSGMGLDKAGLSAMPFLETCQAMARGIGYAGEGDLLTAAFVGALMQGFPETNFIEIFCPSWDDRQLFLSHMGETNYALVNNTPTVARAGTNYIDGPFPYIGRARMKGGHGVFVNICRGRDDFQLVVSAAEMVDYTEDNCADQIRGWMRLGCETADFLEALSRAGATHHSIFVYGADLDAISCFGRLLGLPVTVI